MILHPITPLPLLRDKPWDWFNPWKAWCPGLNSSTTDFSHDYCYGTNVAHFGGPYSLLWYWLMYGVSLGGQYYPLVNNLTVLVLFNFLIVWRLRRRFPGYTRLALVNTLYSWIAFMFMLAWPQILLTLYMTTASLLTSRRLLQLLLLALAPLLRFPLGGPLYLWTFITHFSFHVWGNLPPYLLTGIFWLLCLGFFFKNSYGISHVSYDHDNT